MEQLNERKNNLHLNSFLLLFIVFLFSVLSGYGRLTNYLSAGLLVLVIPICLNIIPQKMTKAFAVLTFFIIFYIFTSIPNYQSLYYLVGTCIMYTMLTFAPFFIRIYVERNDDVVLKKQLFFWTTIIWVCIVWISIITYSSSEFGGRDFANEHRGLFLGGGYSAAYASTLMGVICFYYLISGKKSMSNGVKTLLLIGLILSGMHVFYTMSTITIVALISGCVLSFFFCSKKSKKVHTGTIVFSILFIVVSVLFLINSESIGLWMMRTSYEMETKLFATRLSEVGRFLYSNAESHHMSNRLYTLRVSWQTFLANPIIGVGHKYGNTYELLHQHGVGVHSEFLDSLAKYGIVGSIPYLYFFYLQVKSLVEKSTYRLAMPMAFPFLIMFVFNPFLSVQTIFMLCLYLPLLIELIEKQTN